MNDSDLAAFMKHMRWSRARTARELGISQDRLRRMLSGSVAIPKHIGLACAALAFGLPQWGRAKQPEE